MCAYFLVLHEQKTNKKTIRIWKKVVRKNLKAKIFWDHQRFSKIIYNSGNINKDLGDDVICLYKKTEDKMKQSHLAALMKTAS